MKEIEFNEFIEMSEKLDIRVGEIKTCLRMEGSNKMLKLTVDVGEENLRTVMTSIGNTPGLSDDGDENKLIGKQFMFLCNLKPAKMMGVMSEAMITAYTDDDGRIEGLEKVFYPGNKMI